MHPLAHPCGHRAPATTGRHRNCRYWLLQAPACVLIMPADHLIQDQAAFTAAVDQAVRLASDQHLVTFGIHPTHPETGYGYIKTGEPLGEDGFDGVNVAIFSAGGEPSRKWAPYAVGAGAIVFGLVPLLRPSPRTEAQAGHLTITGEFQVEGAGD